jgi:2-succinyl-6-hydroxy-2,4-cyclohexadiene-1-carboxylate synthase
MDGRPCVTCLHGFSQHGDSWAELRSAVPGPYRWLTPDLHATTPGGVLAEVLALWEVEGVERSHLVGYSQGGRLALRLAVEHPQRLLTLAIISAHAGLEGEERAARLAEDEALARSIEQEGIDWFAGYWAARPLFAGLTSRGPDFLERLDAARRRNDPRHLSASLRGLGQGATLPLWDRLAGVVVPALIVAGERDSRYVEFGGRLARALPRGRLAVVPGAGHAAHLERPDAVARLLAAHLSSR